MKKDLKDLKEVYNGLEINHNTEDIEHDIKYSLVGKRFKSFAFYLSVFAISGGVYFTTMSYIKKEPFRASLIKDLEVKPLMSLFYSSFEDERIEAKELIATNEIKINELEAIVQGRKRFTYSYDQFLNDVKEKKVIVNFDNVLDEALMQYMGTYFLEYLVKNQNDTLALGSKEFSYIDISRKVSELDRVDAIARLKKPVKMVLDSLEMNLNAINEEALTNALISLSSLPSSVTLFFKKLTLSRDGKKALSEAILNAQRKYSISSNGSTKNIKLPTLSKEYEKETAKQKVLFKSSIAKEETQREQNSLKLQELTSNQKKLRELVKYIQIHQNDVTKYDETKEIIENILEGIKWNS